RRHRRCQGGTNFGAHVLAGALLAPGMSPQGWQTLRLRAARRSAMTDGMPKEAKGRTSVARVADDWYVACRSDELRRGPRAASLLGLPLVLFRDGRGMPAALLDRCPHRNAPLSIGRVDGDLLECGYHGWRFDRTGTCRRIPGLTGELDPRGRRATTFPCREQDGFVWVYATPDTTPARAPFRIPLLTDRRYTTIRQTLDLRASVHAAAENALDVPHTAFLHRGLFRDGGEPRDIDVVVRRWHDRVEAEYIGEPRPPGIAGRMLAPGGGVVTHFDRFFLPSIAQIEYRLGTDSHLCITTALTPVSDFHTRMFAVVSLRLPIPGALVAAVLKPIALAIFRQDAEVLRRQTEVIERFGGERYVSTEVDVLGPHILRLLRNAERGDRTPLPEPHEKHVRMRV
ncbi:MAG: Rieske 2Fe-2S domain-containing protein, partial [Myxococcota bacterium]